MDSFPKSCMSCIADAPTYVIATHVLVCLVTMALFRSFFSSAKKLEKISQKGALHGGLAPGSLKMVMVVRRDLKMEKGKIGAQCGHAVLGA